MLEGAKHPSPPGKGGPSGRLRRQADRRYGPAPAPQRAGADDRGWAEAGDRADHQQPGGAAHGDRPGRPAPEGCPGGNVWVVLGRGRAGGRWGGGAPGAPAGGEGVHLPPGQERRERRRGSGGPAADGPAAGGVDRPARGPRAGEITRYRHKLVKLRTSCKDQVHAVLAKRGIAVPHSDLFGTGGRHGWTA